MVLLYASDKKINGTEQSPEVDPRLYMDLMQKISGGIAELGRDVLFNGLELGSSYGEAGSMVPPQLQNSVLEMGHISNTCLHL